MKRVACGAQATGLRQREWLQPQDECQRRGMFNRRCPGPRSVEGRASQEAADVYILIQLLQSGLGIAAPLVVPLLASVLDPITRG